MLVSSISMNVRAEIIEAALSGSSIEELEEMFVGVPLDGVKLMSDDTYTDTWNSEMIWNVLHENGDAAGMVMDRMEREGKLIEDEYGTVLWSER